MNRPAGNWQNYALMARAILPALSGLNIPGRKLFPENLKIGKRMK